MYFKSYFLHPNGDTMSLVHDQEDHAKAVLHGETFATDHKLEHIRTKPLTLDEGEQPEGVGTLVLHAKAPPKPEED